MFNIVKYQDILECKKSFMIPAGNKIKNISDLSLKRNF